MKNDLTTIYISHGDDADQRRQDSTPGTTTTTTLSKKVAQNRAAQKAFRERKMQYVEDLENKAKQLDVWKKTVIQLQADNDCLRKNVSRLEDQLKLFMNANEPHHASPPSPPLSSSFSSPPSSPPSIPSVPIKRKSPLSKREKKKQRLLADAKLYKNDDLEPIQLHCPLALNQQHPTFSNPFLAPPSFITEEVLFPDPVFHQDLFINFVGDLDL